VDMHLQSLAAKSVVTPHFDAHGGFAQRKPSKLADLASTWQIGPALLRARPS
jgi:hypothetical protein